MGPWGQTESRRRRALRLAAETRRAASAARRAEAPHPGRHRRAPEARASYREVFAVGEFRALFSAQVLSYAGDQFAQVAALCTLLFCTVLAGVPFSSARAALMPDVLPGDKFVVGSAVGNITFQASQILGFVAGAAVVAILDPHKTLVVNATTFGISALIISLGVRARPAPARDGAGRTSLWSASTDGIRLVSAAACC